MAENSHFSTTPSLKRVLTLHILRGEAVGAQYYCVQPPVYGKYFWKLDSVKEMWPPLLALLISPRAIHTVRSCCRDMDHLSNRQAVVLDWAVSLDVGVSPVLSRCIPDPVSTLLDHALHDALDTRSRRVLPQHDCWHALMW